MFLWSLYACYMQCDSLFTVTKVTWKMQLNRFKYCIYSISRELVISANHHIVFILYLLYRPTENFFHMTSVWMWLWCCCSQRDIHFYSCKIVLSEFYGIWNEKLRKAFSKSGKTLKYVKRKKNISTAPKFALDFKHSATLIEGFVKLYHLCQISDTPQHADCNYFQD